MRDITVIGGVNVDIEGTPHNKIKHHDSNPSDIRLSFGGVGGNIANNLALMGADVAMVSAVGDDMGIAVKNALTERGIDTSMIDVKTGERSSMYISFLNETGDMEIGMSDMKITERISPADIDRHRAEIMQSRAIGIDANLSAETIRHCVETLGDLPLVLDPVSTTKALRAKPVIGGFYAVKPNIMEAESLTGIKIKDEGDVVKAAQWFLEQGVKQVYITLNKDGVFYTDGSELGFIRPAADLRLVSATGAGDSFSACILYGAAGGLKIAHTARLGMAAAEITMETEKAVNFALAMDEIEKRMNLQR